MWRVAIARKRGKYMMVIGLFMLIVLLLLLIPFVWLKKRNDNPFCSTTVSLPYMRRALMTETELNVYAVLLEALPQYMVFAQVQVSRVLEVPSNTETYYWFNFISRLSYDFVVCRPDSTPIAAIEIDDASHNLPDRQEADHRKNRATQAAGVAIVRWKVGEVPSITAIARLMRKLDKQAV